jgi:membrane-bound metal-dependent hydrolase YbcI (DUF457 family)
MRTPSDVRRTGWVLVFLGVFLVLFMGWITLAMAPLLLDAGVESASGDTFTGSAGEGQMILGLFGAVIVFSLGTVFAGVGQIRTGARDPRIVRAMAGLFVVLIVFALLARFVLKAD